MSKNAAAAEELVRLYDLGLKCNLHGIPVREMNKKELIAFIGFLDELASERMEYSTKLENQCKKSSQ